MTQQPIPGSGLVVMLDECVPGDTGAMEPREFSLSPAQATWMGRSLPANADCDGCVLFGLCAFHATEGWGK